MTENEGYILKSPDADFQHYLNSTLSSSQTTLSILPVLTLVSHDPEQDTMTRVAVILKTQVHKVAKLGHPGAMQETQVQSLGGKILWSRDRLPTPVFLGFPCGSTSKESACNVRDPGSIPGLGRFSWRRERLPTPVFYQTHIL